VKPDLTLAVGENAVPRDALAGIFRVAAAALVTPLRDGMNLVAKEFVASQDPENPGVLVLSQFAGAAAELVRDHEAAARDGDHGRRDDGSDADRADRLLAVTIRSRTGTRDDPLYVHAKVGIVDDRWLTVGSANLNAHSLFNDTEMNVVVQDPGIAAATRRRLFAEHLGGRALGVRPDLHRVVLDPARLRKDLAELALRRSDDGAARIEDDGA